MFRETLLTVLSECGIELRPDNTAELLPVKTPKRTRTYIPNINITAETSMPITRVLTQNV